MTDVILKADGKPYKTYAIAKQQLAAKRLQDTHEVVTHSFPSGTPGWAISPKQPVVTAEPITLMPGDYVLTKRMDEETYHAVAEAFMAAGAGKGEYPDYSRSVEGGYFDSFGWRDDTDMMYHGDTVISNGMLSGGRQLTPAQVLGAVNGQVAEIDVSETNREDRKVKYFKPGDKVILNGYRNDGDDHEAGTNDTIEQWIDEKTILTVTDKETTKEGCLMVGDGSRLYAIHPNEMDHVNTEQQEPTMHLTDLLMQARNERDEAQARYEKVLADHRATYPCLVVEDKFEDSSGQPAENMTDPANWRAGDVLRCVKRDWLTFEKVDVGKEYIAKSDMRISGVTQFIDVFDNNGDHCGAPCSEYVWVRRP